MSLVNSDGCAEPVPGCKVSRAKQLVVLAEANRQDLQNAWLKVLGRRPPVRLSRELLVLALSYQAQRGRSGGLAADELQSLGIAYPDWIAGRSGGSSTTDTLNGTGSFGPRSIGKVRGEAQSFAQPAPRPSPRPVRRSIKPGTRLLREWQGQTHEVIAESTGRFLYRGEAYRSLSAIARTITGTRWSGPTFFGIATKSQAQKAGGGGDA